MAYISNSGVIAHPVGRRAVHQPAQTDASVVADGAPAAPAAGVAAASWLIQGLLLGAVGGAAVSAVVIALVIAIRQLALSF